MKKIQIKEFSCNPFTLIGNEWCLIAAKDEKRFNAMTASWGGMGVLWNKNVVTIYVRPQRYTRELLDAQEYFTLNFFDTRYQKALRVYGSKSGREIDKEKETGLHKVEDGAYGYLQEAKLVLKCRKLYRGQLSDAQMLDRSIDEHYPNKDYHYVYIAEISEVLVEE